MKWTHETDSKFYIKKVANFRLDNQDRDQINKNKWYLEDPFVHDDDGNVEAPPLENR